MMALIRYNLEAKTARLSFALYGAFYPILI